MWRVWWLEELARQHGQPSPVSPTSSDGVLTRDEMIAISKGRARRGKRG